MGKQEILKFQNRIIKSLTRDEYYRLDELISMQYFVAEFAGLAEKLKTIALEDINRYLNDEKENIRADIHFLQSLQTRPR